ncbi:MAG: C39 family peptidase [Candidatus Falkowbacteria bacterium]
MKKFLILSLFSCLFILTPAAKASSVADQTSGLILLQVESHGEAWYVYPANNKRYYLGRPDDAFKIMKQMALGAKHDLIINTEIFPSRLSGMILLDVETNGEAYYIYPKNLKKYYLGRPDDAFRIMRELGLGITNENLSSIPLGVYGEKVAQIINTSNVLIANVPFTAQAPYGDWADQRQENGCEEASSLMAVKWAKGESLTKDEALKQILGASDYIQKKYGESRDVSAKNTVDWILKDYFNYDKVSLVKGITTNDIISELEKGNLVITPMDGVLLNNPNFKAPGPPRHMIVIRGYNPITKEFTTNDPGTRNGELYRYSASVLYGAIRDYPTGYHETITQIEKNMIVVGK